MKVLLTSKNPVKINAVRQAFNNVLEKNVTLQSVDLSQQIDGFTSQPIGEKETLEMCQKRVITAFNIYNETTFDFVIGIEGGIAKVEKEDNFNNFDKIIVYVVISKEKRNMVSVKGCEVPIPCKWVNHLFQQNNIELGILVDKFSNQKGSKQKNGAVGFFTDNAITRFDLLYQAMCCSLIPFKNKSLFF